MSTTENTPAAFADTFITDKAIVAKIHKAMAKGTDSVSTSRRVFANVEDAVNLYSAIVAAAPEAANLAALIIGMDDEGNIAPESYAGSNAVIATVGFREKGGKDSNDGDAADEKGLVGIKGIAIFPIPTLDAFLEDERGRAFLDKILEKEAAHNAFRPLRAADSLEKFIGAADVMSLGVEAIVSSSRAGGGLDTEFFDAAWPDFRKNLRENQPKIADAITGISKAEILNSIRSADWAREFHPQLEQLGLFKWILVNIINPYRQAGTEPTTLVEWLDGRDTLILDKPKAKAVDTDELAKLLSFAE